MLWGSAEIVPGCINVSWVADTFTSVEIPEIAYKARLLRTRLNDALAARFVELGAPRTVCLGDFASAVAKVVIPELHSIALSSDTRVDFALAAVFIKNCMVRAWMIEQRQLAFTLASVVVEVEMWWASRWHTGLITPLIVVVGVPCTHIWEANWFVWAAHQDFAKLFY